MKMSTPQCVFLVHRDKVRPVGLRKVRDINDL